MQFLNIYIQYLKALITTILKMESVICSTGNGVSTAYVSKRKRRLAVIVLATLFFVSCLAVKGIRLFEVMVFQKICLKEKTNINKELNKV